MRQVFQISTSPEAIVPSIFAIQINHRWTSHSPSSDIAIGRLEVCLLWRSNQHPPSGPLSPDSFNVRSKYLRLGESERLKDQSD